MGDMEIEQQALVKKLTPQEKFVLDLLSNGPDKKKIAGELVGLTPSEVLMLRFINNGFDNEQIAEKLTVAICTIKFHCRKITEEFGDSDGTQAAVWRLHNLYDEVVEQQALVAKLTRQEKRVLYLLGLGLNNEEITNRLVICRSTTKAHVSNILAKLGLRDRTQAALWAVHNLYYLELEAAA